jgi:hypothetical protein
MSHSGRYRSLLIVAALVTLSLRALTPEGYMPGSRESGLLFELCPEGMPAEIMQRLSGGGGEHHHHHHQHGQDESSSMSGTEQCPIGHMLSSAFAVDVDTAAIVLPCQPPLVAAPEAKTWQRRIVEYRSRAPPA